MSELIGRGTATGYRALLGNRNYRLYFTGALTASLGDWAGLFALQALVVSLSDQTRVALFALGATMMARVVPSLIVGPAAGVLADRYDRKRLMVVTSLARGLLFLGIAFGTDLTAIFALTFIIECLSLVFVAAKDSSLPVIVGPRQLAHANQLNLLVTYGTLPLGAVVGAAITSIAPLLAGLGIDAEPIRVVLVLDALAILGAGLVYTRVRLPTRVRNASPAAAGGAAGILAELRGGLDFIAERPLVRSLILGVVGIFFGAGVVVTLGAEFVRTELGRPETDWSVLITAVGLGMVAGIGLVGPATRRARKEKVFPLALAATGGLAAVIATLPTFTLTLVFGALLGAAAGIAFVLGYTLLGEATPDDVRGRTFATFYTGTRLALFGSLAIAPFLAGFIGDGIIIFGDFRLFPSGTRMAIFLGGVFGLLSAVSAGRGMARAIGGEHARLPGPDRADEVAEGVFIAFEGGEGSGKSTQVAALAAALEAEGHDVVVTREPGGAPVAERVRQIVLDPNTDGMHPRTEALLYAAARAEHVSRVILPALQAGRVVVCDRFLDSSLAYQGHARGLGEEAVFEINRWAIEGVLPSAVVLLTLDVEEGLRRVAERARRRAADSVRSSDEVPVIPFAAVPDRIEAEDVAFHRAVSAGYLALARKDRERFVVVDASGDPASVARQVRSALHGVLPLPASASPSASQEAARPEDDSEADPAAGSG